VSKAFTREDDAIPAPPVRRRRIPVPAGVPNYITAAGAAALRAELAQLDPSAPNADLRIQDLAEHLACAEVVEPDPAADRVRFGSQVEVEDDAGRRLGYRIVGALEADPKQHAVFWQSPIARALLGARVGDAIALPTGEVVVTAITS
jgi:transcription elongation factor GreB